jgi:hypothetical protein
MRCSATGHHLMATFLATPDVIALSMTSVLSAALPIDGDRLVAGLYGIADRYPGCAACGAQSYMQCLKCFTVSCWNQNTTGWCVICERAIYPQGRIMTLGVVDGA